MKSEFLPVWPDGYIIFQYLAMLKAGPKHNNFAKVGSKIWQTLNKTSTIWQRWIKCCQSGEISPKPVTLAPPSHCCFFGSRETAEVVVRCWQIYSDSSWRERFDKVLYRTRTRKDCGTTDKNENEEEARTIFESQNSRQMCSNLFQQNMNGREREREIGGWVPKLKLA